MRWHLDFAEMRKSSHKPYMCLAIDALSRYVIAIPAGRQTAEVALQLLDAIINLLGVPQQLVTDNGTQFIAARFQTALTERGILHHLTTPHQKTGNGLAERAIQTVQNTVAKNLAEFNRNPNTWYVILPQAVAAYNKTWHNALEMSPFKALFGVECSLTPAEFEEHPILEDFWQQVRHNTRRSQDATARYFTSTVDEGSFQPGDLVFIKDQPSQAQRARKIDLPNPLRGIILELKRRSAVCQTEGGTVRRIPYEYLQHRF